MDIKTPKGQKTLKDEEKLNIEISNKWWINVFDTPKDEPAKVDTILIKDFDIIGIGENKCRYDMYLKDGYLHLPKAKNYNIVDSWLITYEKIEAGRLLAGALCVPFYGFLYLVDDNQVLWWKIANKDGKFAFDFDTNYTTTKATCNGGITERKNAYLPLEHAKELRDKPW